MGAVAAIVDIVTNVFSNSESPCHPNASHQVVAQSDLPFGSRWGLKIFKIATLGPSQIRTILAILNIYVTPMPPIMFGLNPHYSMGEDVFWKISNGPHGGHLGCRIGTNLAVLNRHVSPCLSPSFSLIWYRSRAYVVSRFSSWLPWRPSWILEWNQFGNSKSPCHSNASNQD